MEHDELYHYGIKGMKWGIRRYQNKDGSLTAAGKKREKNKTRGWSKDAKRANNIKKKSVHQMTNAELKELNKRINLEQEYSRLNPNKIKRGLAVAGAIAGGMGTMASLYNNSQNLIKIGQKIVRGVSR